MKRIGLLVVGCLCLSVAVLAGQVITNNTGEDAYGLRVTFSSPVIITGFGDAFTNKKAENLSYIYVLSGGVVPPMATIWFNHSPSTASVVTTEWLSQPSSSHAAAAKDVTVVDHWRADVFELFLPEAVSGESVGTITRTLSMEQIPFVVEYEIELLGRHSNITWISRQTETDQEAATVAGSSARFVYRSNKTDPEVSAQFEIDGQEYNWTDPDIAFPLHNLTEIALDASVFYPDDEISVAWSAANGDPADAVTFPIIDSAASSTTLISDWPNVLTVSCEAAMEDGSTRSEAVEALVYFRDGTPFEIRSVASTVNHPMPIGDLNTVWGQEFALLRSLGVNAITTHILWWFGPPDTDDNWIIHPIWQSRTAWPFDPRGNTILDVDFEALVTRAHAEGFQVYVQLLQYPYQTNPNVEWDYTPWDPTTKTSYSFRATEAWWEGNGEGLNNMFLYYLDDFIRLGVDAVFLGAENGALEQSGGEKTRNFYESIIAEYRGEGFRGGISYAIGFDERYGYYDQLFDPSASGIPLGSMDAIAATYYPVLSWKTDASTLEMQNNVQSHIDEHFQRLSGVYGIPTVLADCYCQAYVGCAVNPLQTSGEVDEECSRRYFTAILREFSQANIDSEKPWIKGLTIAEYKIMLDRYVRDFFEGEGLPSPWLNESGGKITLQLAIKVFFSDNPLLSNDQNGIEPRATEVEILD